jgi:DNA-binding beta-propeller fold protein YncE
MFIVPVGAGGVGYADLGQEEMLGWGPSAFAVDGAGHVWIVDQVNNRLLVFSEEGDALETIDLAAYEVASAFDLAAGPDGLLLLDMHVATDRYRLLELDEGGGLVAVHDLPPGIWLVDGLTGVAMGPDGQLWAELEFGTRVAELDVTGETVVFTLLEGYHYPAGVYGPVAGDPFAYQAADVLVDVSTDHRLGGLTMVGVNPDGSFVLLLDEVTTDDTGAFQIDETVHLFDPDGRHLGSTSFPLADQFLEVAHAVVIGPDGNTYALLTRPDHVAVVRLPYSS